MYSVRSPKELCWRSLEICANGLRELHHISHTSSKWKDSGTRAMGYCWPRRIRSPTTIIIPRNRSHLCMLRNRLPDIIRQCHGQGKIALHSRKHSMLILHVVVPWSPSFLPIHSSHSCRPQIRSTNQANMYRPPQNTRSHTCHHRTRNGSRK